MNNQEENIDQPIPEAQPEPQAAAGGTQGSEDKEKPKNKFDKAVEAIQDLAGGEMKAKLIIILFSFAFLAIILALIVSLFRRPGRQRPADTGAIPTPVKVPTPTPTIPQTLEDIDELIIDIDSFDPDQKDLQPPVVDLEIGL